MSNLTNLNSSVPSTAIAEAVLSDLYVELVPGARFRERMIAGERPSMFYSISGTLVAGDQAVRGEFSLQATNEAGELLTIEGLTNGEFTFAPVKRQTAFAAVQGDANGNIALNAEGEPVLLEELAEGWAPHNVLKSTAHRIPGKTLKLSNVTLSYEGATTRTGHPCAKLRVGGYAVVDAVRISADGAVVAKPKFAAAPRRSAASAAIVLP